MESHAKKDSCTQSWFKEKKENIGSQIEQIVNAEQAQDYIVLLIDASPLQILFKLSEKKTDPLRQRNHVARTPLTKHVNLFSIFSEEEVRTMTSGCSIASTTPSTPRRAIVRFNLHCLCIREHPCN